MSAPGRCLAVRAALREADGDMRRACGLAKRDPRAAAALGLRAARLAAGALVAIAHDDRCTSPWGRARDLSGALRRAAGDLDLPVGGICRAWRRARAARDDCYGGACSPEVAAQGAVGGMMLAGWAREALRDRRRRRRARGRGA